MSHSVRAQVGIRYNENGTTRDGGISYKIVRTRPGYEHDRSSPWHWETTYLFDHSYDYRPVVRDEHGRPVLGPEIVHVDIVWDVSAL
jgi:hypothetical protein